MAYSEGISVILCTYNREKFLRRSIESILSQSYTNFELVLVNNGSTDNSYGICEEFAEKDKRIKLIHIPKNNGASEGRNRGLAAATKDFVTIVDDDDYCEKGMLEHLWKLVQTYEADISICGSWNEYENRLEPYFIFDDLLILNKIEGINELIKREKYNVAPPTKLFKKNLFDKLKFPIGVLVDDIHIIYKVFANANRIVAEGTPLYRFRKHEGNMTGFIQDNKLTPELLKEYLNMYKDRTRYLTERIPEIYDRLKYSEWSYMLSMCNKIRTYDVYDCKKEFDDMVSALKEDFDKFFHSPFITDKEKLLLKEYIK